MTVGEKGLSHIDGRGAPRMVDVSGKEETDRFARAEALVRLGPAAARAVRERGGVAKGNVIETARIAAILAAKRTSDLVPLCHPLPLDRVDVDLRLEGEVMRIVAEVACRGRTGVEMEAMTAAAVGALTVYDMCKSAGKGITIETIRLLAKRGGKSGDWARTGAAETEAADE